MLVAWITFNSVELLYRPFDPFPYILLNLVLSCLAAIQAVLPVFAAAVRIVWRRLQAPENAPVDDRELESPPR